MLEISYADLKGYIPKMYFLLIFFYLKKLLIKFNY